MLDHWASGRISLDPVGNIHTLLEAVMKTLSRQTGSFQQAQAVWLMDLWPSLAVWVALGVGDMEKREVLGRVDEQWHSV